MELGGKSPAVVFKDADLPKIVPLVCQAILALTGQACIAAARVLVEEEIYDEVVEGVKEFLEKSEGNDRRSNGEENDDRSVDRRETVRTSYEIY